MRVLSMLSGLAFATVALAGCGGGGGHADDELQFRENVPSEQVLCSFAMGVTTRDQVEEALGEPESFNDNDLGSSVQYWYGNAAVPTDLKIILLGFDRGGIFDTALLQQIPYPRCWREQEEERVDDDTP